MNTRQKAVENIPAKILPAEQNDPCAVGGVLIGKERHDRLSCELYKNRYKNSEGRGQRHGVIQRLFRPFGLARADVLRSERRDRREHGGGDEEQEADDFFDDADCRRIVQSAAVGNDRNDDKTDLDQPVLKRNGNADAKKLADDRLLRAKVFFFERDPAFCFDNGSKRRDNAQRLRKRCSERRADGTQAQCAHEKKVKRNVGGTGDGDEIKRTFRVAYPAVDRAYNVVCRNKGNADKAHREIRNRSRNGVFGGGHDDTIPRTEKRRIPVRTSDKAINSVTVLPMA